MTKGTLQLRSLILVLAEFSSKSLNTSANVMDTRMKQCFGVAAPLVGVGSIVQKETCRLQLVGEDGMMKRRLALVIHYRKTCTILLQEMCNLNVTT